MLVKSGDSAVDLFFGHDEGRRDDKVRDPCLNRDTVSEYLRRDLIHQQRFTGDLVGIRVEWLFCHAILDEVDCPEETFAAYIADTGMAALEFVELFTDIRLKFFRSLYESKTLQLVDRCDRRGERQRVCFVGVAVGEVVILEELCDLLARCAETKRNIGRGDSLRRD